MLLAGTAFAGTIRGSVVAAIDVYSRSILAVRVQEGMEKSIDVTFMLRDIMRPVHMRPEWKDDRRWAYVGIPESVLLDSGIASGTVSALPIAQPETVVMDHGTTYKSKLTLAACESLGISVAPSRKGRGSDKAVIERFFGSLKTNLLQTFPTYLGADPGERARHLEQQPALTAMELERVIQRWVIEWWQQHVMDELRPDWCPEGKFSPEELYSYGLAQTGVALRVPTQLEYVRMLPHVTVDITDRGVKVLGLHYDDPSLINLRGRPAPHGGQDGGKWAVFYEPRDLRRVWLVDDRDAIRELSWTRAAHEIPAFNVADAKAMRDTAKAMGLRRRTNEDLLEILLDIVSTEVPGYVDPKTRSGAPKTRAAAPKKTRAVVKASRSEFSRQRLATDQASFVGLTPDEPGADMTAGDSSAEDSSAEDMSAFPRPVPFKAQAPAATPPTAAPAPRPQNKPARRSILFPFSEESS